jgi:predicted transcriptional regulator
MLIEEVYRKEVVTVGEGATVKDAVELLVQKRFNGLIVTDGDGRVRGVLSVQDIAGAMVPKQFRENTALAGAMYHQGFFHEQVQKIAHFPVKRVMRRDFLTVTLQSNIMEVMADFLFKDLYIVPVVSGRQLVGMVTRSEIKKAIAAAMFEV